jgi:hypothetical protein
MGATQPKSAGPYDDTKAPDVLILVSPQKNLPSFIHKIHVTSKYDSPPPGLPKTTATFTGYAAAIVINWGILAPIIIAALLFVGLIIYLVMKMRKHSTLPLQE